MINFKKKYLKYKFKYLNLKGGMDPHDNPDGGSTSQVLTPRTSKLSPSDEKQTLKNFRGEIATALNHFNNLLEDLNSYKGKLEKLLRPENTSNQANTLTSAIDKLTILIQQINGFINNPNISSITRSLIRNSDMEVATPDFVRFDNDLLMQLDNFEASLSNVYDNFRNYLINLKKRLETFHTNINNGTLDGPNAIRDKVSIMTITNLLIREITLIEQALSIDELSSEVSTDEQITRLWENAPVAPDLEWGQN